MLIEDEFLLDRDLKLGVLNNDLILLLDDGVGGVWILYLLVDLFNRLVQELLRIFCFFVLVRF